MQHLNLRQLAHPLQRQVAFGYSYCAPHNLKKPHRSAVRHSFSTFVVTHRQRKPALLRAAALNSSSAEMASNTSDEGSSPSNPDQSPLYFCYGSNMVREKLKHRFSSESAQITFTQVWKARLPDWQLCFDLAGVPPQEPCMSSIRKQKGDEVYGLIYQIATEDCWKKLLLSEGVTEHQGKHNSYHVITVEVECFESEKSSETRRVLVKTLTTNPRFCIPNHLQTIVHPSKRYMNLLVHGAKQEQLPSTYVQRLEAVPVARRWEPSVLLRLMSICVPFTFMTRRRWFRFFAYPLSTIGIFLYAMHEKFEIHSKEKSFSRTIGFWLCRAIMFVFYGLYCFPACLCLLFSRRGRQLFKFFLMSTEQNIQHDRPAQTTSR